MRNNISPKQEVVNNAKKSLKKLESIKDYYRKKALKSKENTEDKLINTHADALLSEYVKVFNESIYTLEITLEPRGRNTALVDIGDIAAILREIESIIPRCQLFYSLIEEFLGDYINQFCEEVNKYSSLNA